MNSPAILYGTYTLGSGSLSSQRISELFSQMTKTGRDDFYHAWSSSVCESDGIALDITSISSYSELMGSVEWGYNRDHEDLRQINLCMLLGEFTRLPIYYSIYSGSLRDVSTLRTTLAELAAICPDMERKVVMDKGFFSTANIKGCSERIDAIQHQDECNCSQNNGYRLVPVSR